MHNPFEPQIGEAVDGHVRVEVQGDVDLAVAPQVLDAALCAGLAFDDHEVVLDLGGVTFIDSSGLAALVEADRALQHHASHLVVANPSKQVSRVIELVGLDARLDVRRGWDPRRRDGAAVAR